MTVRIVMDGAPAAGTTTLFGALAAEFDVVTSTPLWWADPRIEGFDWFKYPGGLYEGRPLRAELMALHGGAELEAVNDVLRTMADVFVLVVEATEAGAAAAREHLAMSREAWDGLDELCVPILVVVATKSDLPGAIEGDRVREILGVSDRTPLAETSATTDTGLKMVLAYAMREGLSLHRRRASAGALLTRPLEPYAIIEFLDLALGVKTDAQLFAAAEPAAGAGYVEATGGNPGVANEVSAGEVDPQPAPPAEPRRYDEELTDAPPVWNVLGGQFDVQGPDAKADRFREIIETRRRLGQIEQLQSVRRAG